MGGEESHLYPIGHKYRLSLKVFGACEIHGHGSEVSGISDLGLMESPVCRASGTRICIILI